MNVKEATESSEPMSMREGSRGEGGWYKETGQVVRDGDRT